MVDSPCKYCKHRAIPKNCETECKLWQDYLIEKKKENNKIMMQKRTERRIADNLWRNEQWL